MTYKFVTQEDVIIPSDDLITKKHFERLIAEREAYRDVAIIERSRRLNYQAEPTLVSTWEYIDAEVARILEGKK